MGGHAFKHLHCPRMTPEMYLRTREHATNVICTLFKHVVVPTEMPGKADYGDVDFLVSGFLLDGPGASFNWQRMVARTKDALETPHGKHGYLNPDVMYFAVPMPDEEHVWIQIDIKVVDAQDEEAFAWNQFQLNYASGLKMLGSLIKPLGITISPSGLHIRVEEMEGSNFPGSLVLVTRQPEDVLRILGLDRRFLYGGFASKEEVYQYFASTWVFNPAHYAARLAEGKYRDHLEDRSGPWVHFITEWLPERYPGYRFPGFDEKPLDDWRAQMRVILREKVFTMFPHITPEYYTKRSAHLKEVEEHRLQQLLMDALPKGRDGWTEDMPQPPVVMQAAVDQAPVASPPITIESAQECSDEIFKLPPTPPRTPPPPGLDKHLGEIQDQNKDPLLTPLHLAPLPRTPPLEYAPHPPPSGMATTAKLACLARWTLFDISTGTPYLACSPRDKGLEMHWSDSDAGDESLVRWAKEMWWVVWVRQTRVNYVGMWKRRFEKEDAKAEKQRVEREAVEEREKEDEAKKAKIVARLSLLNGC